jgi:putative MFS transporter
LRIQLGVRLTLRRTNQRPVIAGASNFVAPKATLDALVPAFNYFAAWYLLAVIGFLFIGIETRGRTIEELDAALARPVPIKAAAG